MEIRHLAACDILAHIKAVHENGPMAEVREIREYLDDVQKAMHDLRDLARDYDKGDKRLRALIAKTRSSGS